MRVSRFSSTGTCPLDGASLKLASPLYCTAVEGFWQTEMTSRAKDDPATTKPLQPTKETQQSMKPISRKAFTELLKRAVASPVVKPAPKAT